MSTSLPCIEQTVLSTSRPIRQPWHCDAPENHNHSHWQEKRNPDQQHTCTTVCHLTRSPTLAFRPSRLQKMRPAWTGFHLTLCSQLASVNFRGLQLRTVMMVLQSAAETGIHGP